MADELFDTLLRFHREVVQPELNEIRGEIQAVRGEMATELQAIRGEMATRAELQAMRAEMVTWPVLIRFYNDVIKPEIDNIRPVLESVLSGNAFPCGRHLLQAQSP